ncbi:hypothetical protein Ancab_011193, partial [Ancistrocladus abbreviatus]
MSIRSFSFSVSHLQSCTRSEQISLTRRWSNNIVVEVRVLGFFEKSAASSQIKAGLRVSTFNHCVRGEHAFIVNSIEPESVCKTASFSEENDKMEKVDTGGSDGDNGRMPPENGVGDGGGGGENEDGKEFGAVLKFVEVMTECEKRG